MNPSEKPAGCCAASLDEPDRLSVNAASKPTLARYILLGIAGLVVWWLVYRSLAPLAAWLTYSLLTLPRGSHLGAAVEFFVYEAPKVLMLLMLVVFGVGIVRSFFTPERTRRILSGKREFVGNVLAALLGVVTPFCSCSACPLFIGFVTAGVPLGVTFSFLVSAPMVNEVALALLFGLFGWKIAAIYLGTGLVIALISGWVIGQMGMEKYVEPWALHARVPPDAAEQSLTWPERIHYGRDAVRDIVGRVWLYVALGIGVGAGIHGYVPDGLLASFMGKGVWWAVPVAVLIGVPLYSNAAGIIPVVQALLGKGAALGTVLAFMMSVIGISTPEAVILRKVIKWPLILIFFGIVAVGIIIVGYLFNLIM
ncbi:MAG: permease [Verrucomicrobiia bacterium]